eukprot:385742-Pelagomonas_calceolata.AAC.1
MDIFSVADTGQPAKQPNYLAEGQIPLPWSPLPCLQGVACASGHQSRGGGRRLVGHQCLQLASMKAVQERRKRVTFVCEDTTQRQPFSCARLNYTG